MLFMCAACHTCSKSPERACTRLTALTPPPPLLHKNVEFAIIVQFLAILSQIPPPPPPPPVDAKRKTLDINTLPDHSCKSIKLKTIEI